ncbi:DegT/DnrJ/EryC1/StrS family aminotransferase [Winogradskyella sp. 3972H.M.0a.05]|uniref:DegT/DnrJ/EryC1/StrS family aminotransferase n=1 Tax=Winogradskyella sp. 3972H.M.0a.05 TaxID=2950277 RepID=UPI003395904D
MIKFLDLHKVNQRFKADFEAELGRFLDGGQYILGDYVKSFETNFADYCGTKYCIGTANGLDALTLILKSYIHLGRLAPNDEVIVPANTFIATILSVLHAGLKPVLVEPDADTYNISSKAVKEAISNDTKAIIAVHLYGQLADMNALQALSKTHDLLLIEDAAQAHGALDSSGTIAGNLSDAAAFSFYPSKNLGALGDGGAVTTNDEDLMNVLRSIHNYGSEKKYENEIIGFNSRLDDIQALFLNFKLKKLDEDNAKRRSIALRYLDEITNKKVILPTYNRTKDHVFYVFMVRVEQRDDFRDYLLQNNIESHIHYPKPPHKQNALTMFNQLRLPITEKIHDTCVSIPMSPLMTNGEIDKVIQVINAY